MYIYIYSTQIYKHNRNHLNLSVPGCRCWISRNVLQLNNIKQFFWLMLFNCRYYPANYSWMCKYKTPDMVVYINNIYS